MAERAAPVYEIRVTEASGDFVSLERVREASQAEAERTHAAHWNEHYGHTSDRYLSELLRDGEVVSAIGGWEEDED